MNIEKGKWYWCRLQAAKDGIDIDGDANMCVSQTRWEWVHKDKIVCEATADKPWDEPEPKPEIKAGDIVLDLYGNECTVLVVDGECAWCKDGDHHYTQHLSSLTPID